MIKGTKLRLDLHTVVANSQRPYHKVRMIWSILYGPYRVSARFKIGSLKIASNNSFDFLSQY